jgi:hypothetical protein
LSEIPVHILQLQRLRESEFHSLKLSRANIKNTQRTI